MGSRGTGRFEDFPPSRPEATQTSEVASEGGESDARADDVCLAPLQGVALEDVERCGYFQANDDVPPPGTDVRLVEQLVAGRLAVGTDADGQVLGYLPTGFNYLRRCLEQGHRYVGDVTLSDRGPVAQIRVDLNPAA